MSKRRLSALVLECGNDSERAEYAALCVLSDAARAATDPKRSQGGGRAAADQRLRDALARLDAAYGDSTR